ncbi:hypothetical protein QBB34_04100 [Streptomyces stelliscabiei]|uniref:hypothetical protein n=1 Tax=Streptomyces stelliscabiei TaxID=146820 RepID=UPI002FEEB366
MHGVGGRGGAPAPRPRRTTYEPISHLSIALVDELTDAPHATDAAVVVATHDRQLRRDIRTWPRLTLSPQGAPHREAPSDR